MTRASHIVIVLMIDPEDMRAADFATLRDRVRAFTQVELLTIGGKLLGPAAKEGKKAR